MATYLVTGAAGHLGEPRGRGADRARRPRAGRLLLPGERCPDFIPRRDALSEVFGDVRDAGSLDALFVGAGYGAVVIHCAGIVEITGKTNRRLFDVNVGGTRNVLDACARHSARRLGLCQFCSRDPDAPARRSDAGRSTRSAPTTCPAPMTRARPRRRGWCWRQRKAALDAVCVHPAGIIGPHANPRVGAARLISACLKGQLPAAIRGGFDFVDVRDVAEGILAAADSGRSGACYILSNRFISFRELLDTLTGVAGIRRIRLYLPAWIAFAFAPLAEGFYRLTRKAPLFTRYALRTATQNALYSHERATRELNYRPRSLSRTMIDIVAASPIRRRKRALQPV